MADVCAPSNHREEKKKEKKIMGPPNKRKIIAAKDPKFVSPCCVQDFSDLLQGFSGFLQCEIHVMVLLAALVTVCAVMCTLCLKSKRDRFD